MQNNVEKYCTCFGFTFFKNNSNNATKVETNDDLDQSIHSIETRIVQASETIEEQLQHLKEPEETAESRDVEFTERIETESNPIQFDWEKEYFNGFDWLNQETEKYIITENLANYINHLHVEADIHSEPLCLYFISLENNKMFLYDCEEKSDDEVMAECQEMYEYVQINKPIKIVFFLPNIQKKEIDDNVKLFMHEFGIENTRGGSYSSVDLPDETKRELYTEFSTYTSKHNK